MRLAASRANAAHLDHNVVISGSRRRSNARHWLVRWLLAAIVAFTPSVAWAVDDLIVQLEEQLNRATSAGNYKEAERIGLQMVDVARRRFADDPSNEAAALADLAGAYIEMRRFMEVEPLAKRSLQIYERLDGPNSVTLATPLQNLGAAYVMQGRYRESEQAYRRAWKLWEQEYGPNNQHVAVCISGLAAALSGSGRFAEAEPLYKRVIEIQVQNFGRVHPEVARSMQHMGQFYAEQSRTKEAIAWYQQAIEVYPKLKGAEASYATALTSLSYLFMRLGRWAEAERYHKQSRELYVKSLGEDHPYVRGDDALVNIYIAQDRYAEAETELKKVLEYRKKHFGARSVEVAANYLNYGRLASNQQRAAEAYAHFSDAIEIYGAAESEVKPLMDCYMLRASLVASLPDHKTWQDDLLKAIELAERIRASIAGGERERSESFEALQNTYRLAASMLIATGQVERGLEISELNRSRTLLEQMLTAHVDLLAGLPKEQADKLRKEHAQCELNVTTLEKEIQAIGARADLSEAERVNKATPALKQLALARQRLVESHAAIRSASVRYRQAIQDSEKVSLATMRQWLAEREALLLYFMVGSTGTEILAIDGSSEPITYQANELTAEQSKALGIEAKALSRNQLTKILLDERQGVLSQLRRPESAQTADARLKLLWEILIPGKQREQILASRYKRLMIVPEGALSLLPFEALVVEEGENPKRLIDVGPAIEYAPSQTILYRLAQREPYKASPTIQPVLAVGDPAYRQGTVSSSVTGLEASRRARVGSRLLKRLPYSGREATWVAQVYKKNGVPAAILKEEQATEANVRFNLTGRRVIHLACHGLVDESYDNFFGGLALAPSLGAQATAADDGLLTLNEICQLNLRGCELAILSACETNYGPEQYGEGVWALTRGFLVAGARRVVASNWLVDDEAAASLISYYCGILAQNEKEGQPVDYAAALADAKRWVRQQPRWSHPYYWATFVLVGPN